MPVAPRFSVDRIPELRAALHEFNDATDAFIALLDAMLRPQLVPKRRRGK